MPAFRLIPSRLAEEAVPSRRYRSRAEGIERLRSQAVYLEVRLRAVPGYESIILALVQRRRALERLFETESRLRTEMVMTEASEHALRELAGSLDEDAARIEEVARRRGELAAEEAQLEARWQSERRAFTSVKRRLDHRVAARFHARS